MLVLTILHESGLRNKGNFKFYGVYFAILPLSNTLTYKGFIMEFLPQMLIVSFGIVFFYIMLKPKTKPKPNPQKQEEIREMYRQRCHTELAKIEKEDDRQKKKIDLLKTFAKELEFNLFFDKDDVKLLMQELAKC